MARCFWRPAAFLAYFILTILGAIFLFPICVTLTNSLMSPFEIISRYTGDITPANGFGLNGAVHYVEMGLIPAFITLRQYLQLLFGSPLYLGLFWNSVLIAVPVTAGQLLFSVPAAYAFELSKFKYKEAVFFIYIVVMLTPLQAALVPNFLTVEFLRINGTPLAIILPGMLNPFGVFLVRQSLKGLPGEYVEAAKVDGAGHLRIIFSIIRPMITSAAAALAVLTFVEYWNVVDQAVVFIKDSAGEPLSVYLSRMGDDNLDMVFAASCFYMFPPLLIFLFGNDNMVEGIQLSGVK